jgi:hypothetical protein
MQTVNGITLGEISWDRIVNAAERVRQRLIKVVATLESAGIPYAIAGGNAVASWISRIDESLVRATRDVDVLLRRDDFPAARAALEAAGFSYHRSWGVDVFTDGPATKLGEGVHIIYAKERVTAGDAVESPDVTDSEVSGDMRITALDGLVRMKLNAFRLKDKVHLMDMIGAGLVDAGWCNRLPASLADRLRELLENPNG